MKKLFKYLLTLGVAAFSFAACEDEQLEPVNFTISGDSSFNESLEATVKVTGDREAPADILVGIVLDDATTFPSSALSFPATVKIAAGSKEATVTVKIAALQALEGGKEYKAVIAAKVNDVLLTQKVTITFAKPEDPATFRFTADGAFFNNIAMLKVEASKPVKEETLVTITLDAKSTIPAEALTIPELKIAKGEQHGEIAVTLNPEVLEPGKEYSAIFNATIGNEAIGTGTVGFNKPDLNGKWTVIGLGGKWGDSDDIAMTEGADGWYTAEGVTVANNDEFKFRRDAKWDLAYGLAEKGQPELDKEFAVVTTAGCPNIGIAAEGIYSLSVNPNKAVAKIVKTGDIAKNITLADLVALMPAENNAKADFKGILTNVLVTYVSGNNVFLEDASGAILLYLKDSGLQAGVTLSGYFEGKVQNFNNLPEISELKFNKEEITFGTAEVPAPAEMTIADVLAGFDRLISKRVKIVNAYAGADIQKKGEYSIFQGESSIPFYVNVDLTKGFKAGSIFDVIAIVTPYKEKKQLKIFEEAAITRLIPVMTMSDIQALCTSSSNASFAGVFKGLYVNYILGTQHIYLEDESGALRYYKETGNTLKVGDKISGVITGTCKLDSGRPTINWLDTKYATVTSAPEEERPKPVTGTLGSFTNVAGLMYRRVILENVVLDADVSADKSTQIVNISDGTGTMPLHLRFKPSQAIPKGYKISGTGTFDVNGGKLEIRIFAQKEVTSVTAPAEPKLTVERLWGKYSTADAAWNAYYGGTANSDRNLAMDDDYIFVQESTAAAKIWKIPVDGTSSVSSVNVEGVSGGTHAISCIRMVPNTASGVNGGKDFLMGVSLTTDDGSTAMKVYSWGNGVDAAPTATSASTWCGRRLGDKFTVYGSLQDGALFFKDYNNASDQGAFMVLRMAWSEVPSDGYFNPRRTNMFVEGGMGAYYPLPGNASAGLYTSTASAKFAQFTSSPLNTSPNTSGTFVDAGGYYVNAHGFNCFEFNGKRYIAYVKNADGGDGRFYIIEGESTTDWADMLGSKRNVIYQAAIQENLAYTDGEYHAELGANPSPKTSGNSAIDCAIRVKSDGVYFAVMKQHVGLSLFKMSMK